MTKLSKFEKGCLEQLISKTHLIRGTQYPNPVVGAMVIKDNQFISDGYHKLAGGDHAEVIALKKAHLKAKGATLLVTLEPCSHYGKTKPCVQQIIDFGIRRCIWAINDPNPAVYGKSKSILEANGIDVVSEADPSSGLTLIKEFNAFYKLKRPFIYVKAALSLDGKIAPNSNGLNYISSDASLHLVQILRTYVQAICVGAKTINIDQPRLSVRIERDNNTQPLIVILDPRNYVDMAWVKKQLNNDRNIALFQSQECSFKHAHLNHYSALSNDKVANWRYVFESLYQLNIHGVLVEGGSAVFQSLLKSNLFDELWVTKVPKVFGHNAVSFLKNEDFLDLNLSLNQVDQYDSDVVMRYKNNHVSDFR